MLASGLLSIMGRKKEEKGDDQLSTKQQMLKLEYEEIIYLQQKKNKLLDEVTENDKELDLDLDTYSMAFKALNWECIKEIELKETEVNEAF